MEFGWLQQVTAGFLGAPWLGTLRAGEFASLVGAVIAIVLTTGIVLLRRRRRAVVVRAQRVRGAADVLKQELRLRLAEPALFANGSCGGPTMGAGAAFETDIAAAAKTLLEEAGGQRAKAKELLRRRVNGNAAANGRLNGSEAGYWRQLGALSLLDSATEALAAYARAADLAPDDAEAQMLLGVLQMRTGNLAAAEAAFRRQIELGNGKATGPLRYRGHAMLGDVHALREARAAALAAYAEAQGEVRKLSEGDPDNAGLKRDLSVTWDRIGDLHAEAGAFEAALESYRHSLEIAEALARRDPDNAVWQHDLSVTHDRMGDVLERKGEREAALASFRRGLDIAKALAVAEPESPQRQWDLSVSHDRIGDVLIALGRMEPALESYRQGMAIVEGLTVRDPGHAGWQRDLAVCCQKIGAVEALRNPAEARALLEKGRAIIARLDSIAAHQAQWRSDLSKFDEVLRTLQ